jgi:hypothetical protein
MAEHSGVFISGPHAVAALDARLHTIRAVILDSGHHGPRGLPSRDDMRGVQELIPRSIQMAVGVAFPFSCWSLNRLQLEEWSITRIVIEGLKEIVLWFPPFAEAMKHVGRAQIGYCSKLTGLIFALSRIVILATLALKPATAPMIHLCKTRRADHACNCR